MNVLMITYTLSQVGGIERVIALLSKYFVETNDWNVTILSLWSKSMQRAYFEMPSKVRIINGACDIGKKKETNNTIYQTIEREMPDVVFTFHPGTGVHIMAMKRKIGKTKWIATEHNDPLDYTWKRRLLNLLTYKSADRFVVLTDAFVSYYRKRAVRADKIPNPCSIKNTDLPSTETAEETRKRIVAIGRLTPVKGFDLLCQAMQGVLPKHADWVLQIVGDGEETSNLIQLTKVLGIEDQVEFLGFRRDVDEVLKEAAICVVPSRYEAFSMVVLEALEMGVPVVSFELPGVKEMENGTGCVRFVKKGDVESLGNAIQEIMEDDANRAKMGLAAKERAAFYTIESIGSIWTEYIQNLCGQQSLSNT